MERSATEMFPAEYVSRTDRGEKKLRRRGRRVWQGLLAGLAPPAGWALVCTIFGMWWAAKPFFHIWLMIYLSLTSLTCFGVGGYILGKCQEAAKKAELVDPLTGIFNAHCYHDRLSRSFAHAQRYEEPLSLLLIDLYDFKEFNNSYGRKAGDAALAHVAGLLSKLVRNDYILARVGGEEFAVILQGAGSAGAQALAETIRKAFRKNPVSAPGGEKVHIPLSMGAAGTDMSQPESAAELHAEAEKTLVIAFSAGPDRIAVEDGKPF